MTITLKYVNLFTAEGRLLKEIPVAELPKYLPDFISYAGNIYRQVACSNGYSEVVPHVYEEKAHTPSDEPKASPSSDDTTPKATPAT